MLRLDGVGTATGGLGDHVTRVVDDICVIAGPAGHRIGADAAVEPIGGAVAGERVVQRIAAAIDRIRPSEDEVLDLDAERVADAGLHRVSPSGGGFRDAVARAVDDIGVVPGAARHRVRTGAAVEAVGCTVARQHVVQRIAGAIDSRLFR